MSKTWFITGTSRGFGREWAVAALERGDQVVATARDASRLDDLTARFGEQLLALTLDVDDKAAVETAVAQAVERFGRIDVAVNNAGYGQFGMVEEVTEAEARAQFETNVFGALWVTQAVLPVMRTQGGGHVLQVSSIGGISAFPNIGLYNASKWALEGFSQSLAAEVADFGIKVTLIEPGGFSTDWGGASAKHAAPLPAYDAFREKAAEARRTRMASPGDPSASAAAVLELVDAPNPPLRVFFGTAPLGIATADYESRLAEWKRWQHLSELSQGS
ncbi:NAD(P)-dependent dehydrogenase (short-subunit alcohol dehydrogenase family) [Kineococcus radiotolerans]|uniref:Short-chain dehydrogenase/reductase SDR n=2 Tax=Kineococcus radiotolerans TaxID=131568 RepID=A6W6S4_KINRD|nr:SDR family oxidoreductase [Kineococcus radiotolerans]ABS02513.1 short-chain dehydrogenase/reductase SDR [Kineococcus radiotolerans SRS30216 = ATCC BAA-149]MBB2900291.1 NAD(P)-dependent dehydrogenase (short-subunit alcohol dehydrogenase family) [Kineococcus radiotolerans]